MKKYLAITDNHRSKWAQSYFREISTGFRKHGSSNTSTFCSVKMGRYWTLAELSGNDQKGPLLHQVLLIAKMISFSTLPQQRSQPERQDIPFRRSRNKRKDSHNLNLFEKKKWEHNYTVNFSAIFIRNLKESLKKCHELAADIIVYA